jgi:hypothetical protein
MRSIITGKTALVHEFFLQLLQTYLLLLMQLLLSDNCAFIVIFIHIVYRNSVSNSYFQQLLDVHTFHTSLFPYLGNKAGCIFMIFWESFIILEGNWSKTKTIKSDYTLFFCISISNNCVLVKISIGTSYFELY